MKIVFLGNRQAQWLCEIYRGLSGESKHAHWIDSETTIQTVHSERLAAADVIALQARGRPLAFDLDALEAKGERVWFPELALDFLWPFSGQPHMRNTRDVWFPDGPFPVELGDAWLNRRLQRQQPAETIEAEYLALDVGAVIDLDAYKTMALERQGEIDRVCGEDFASRLEADFRQRALFVNPLRPAAELMRDLANRLFSKIGLAISLPQDWRPDERSIPELPVHPSVAAHFDLAWTQARRYRIWTPEAVDFAEYVRRYLAYAEGPELEAGLKLVAERRWEEGLRMLELAAARPLGRRSEAGRRAIASAAARGFRSKQSLDALHLARTSQIEGSELAEAMTHFAKSRWREAEAAALAFLKKAPKSSQAWALLAEVRQRLDDKQGRVAALRAAIANRPADSALRSRLTADLADQGNFHAAIASAEAELALEPENPRICALLSLLLERVGERDRAKAALERALALIADAPQYADVRAALNSRHADPQTKLANHSGDSS